MMSQFYTLYRLKSFLDRFLYLFDLFLFFLVVSLFCYQLVSSLFSFFESVHSYFALNTNNIIFLGNEGINQNNNNAAPLNSGQPSQSSTHTHHTEFHINHNTDNWQDRFRSAFIYGTGALRYAAIRSGPIGTRALTVTGTIGLEYGTRLTSYMLADPTYIGRLGESISIFRSTINNSFNSNNPPVNSSNSNNPPVNSSNSNNLPVNSSVNNTPTVNNSLNNNAPNLNNNNQVDLSTSAPTSSNNSTNHPENSNNFISSDNNPISDLFTNIFKQFGSLLEPVSVPYSNELLLNQIHGLSIALLIIAVSILILLLIFIVNVIIVLNKDRILNYFNNKYILLFVKFNLRIIGIEVFFLGGSIIYGLYFIIKGLHFIAVHPINLT